MSSDGRSILFPPTLPIRCFHCRYSYWAVWVFGIDLNWTSGRRCRCFGRCVASAFVGGKNIRAPPLLVEYCLAASRWRSVRNVRLLRVCVEYRLAASRWRSVRNVHALRVCRVSPAASRWRSVRNVHSPCVCVEYRLAASRWRSVRECSFTLCVCRVSPCGE